MTEDEDKASTENHSDTEPEKEEEKKKNKQADDAEQTSAEKHVVQVNQPQDEEAEPTPKSPRTMVVQTLRQLAQGVVIPGRLSPEAQKLMSQQEAIPEAESDAFTPDGYSRQQLGDQPLVIDMGTDSDKGTESGEGTGLSVYHTLSSFNKETPPSHSGEREIDATGNGGLLTSTPTGKGSSWAENSPEATLEPSEASKVLEGNFQGRQPRFVYSNKHPSLSPITGKRDQKNVKDRQSLSLERPASKTGARAKLLGTGKASPMAPPRPHKSPPSRPQRTPKV